MLIFVHILRTNMVTLQIELKVVLFGQEVCADLSIVFVRNTNESCQRKWKCHAYDLHQSYDYGEGTTICLVSCDNFIKNKIR